MWQVRLDLGDNGDVLFSRLQLHHLLRFIRRMGQIGGFFVQLVTASLNARQVKDFVDELQQMAARTVNVAEIFLVMGIVDWPHHFVGHHLGKAEDRVQRRAQLVAHGGQEARLCQIGFFSAAAGFIGNTARGFQFHHQLVTFRARLEIADRGIAHGFGDYLEEDQGCENTGRCHHILKGQILQQHEGEDQSRRRGVEQGAEFQEPRLQQ